MMSNPVTEFNQVLKSARALPRALRFRLLMTMLKDEFTSDETLDDILEEAWERFAGVEFDDKLEEAIVELSREAREARYRNEQA